MYLLLNRVIDNLLDFLAFCYRGGGARGSETTFAPKIFEKVERTIETIAYCFKNNGLLSFALFKFFQQKSTLAGKNICFIIFGKTNDR